MLTAVIPPVLSAVRADAVFVDLWDGVKGHMGETPPYLFMGRAPDNWPKPFVIYDVYDDEQEKFGPPEWPVKGLYLEFLAYDFAGSAERALRLVERIGQICAFRLWDTDRNLALAVRTYENDGPVMINTGSKLEIAYRLTLPLRGCDVAALQAKTVGPR